MPWSLTDEELLPLSARVTGQILSEPRAANPGRKPIWIRLRWRMLQSSYSSSEKNGVSNQWLYCYLKSLATLMRGVFCEVFFFNFVFRDFDRHCELPYLWCTWKDWEVALVNSTHLKTLMVGNKNRYLNVYMYVCQTEFTCQSVHEGSVNGRKRLQRLKLLILNCNTLQRHIS